MSYGKADRRRAIEDDDDDVDRKRRRAPDLPDIEQKLLSLIRRVGEKSTSSLESNLESLVGVLEQDLAGHATKMIAILKHCVLTMPEKLSIYSTLVGLFNAKHFNFGGEFVETLVRELSERMTQGDYDRSLILVTFLCDLVNCRVISLTSILQFLEGFIEAAYEENIPQVRSDWFLYAVLHALPWIGGELAEKKPEELKNLLDAIQRVLARREKLHVQLLRVWSTDKPHAQLDSLDSLAMQINKLREDDWHEGHISRHYVAFDAQLCQALQHNLPSFAPPAHTSGAVYPLPSVVFRLFDYADCPEDGPVLPGAQSIERFLVEEELAWIIQQHCRDRKDCAQQLLNYGKRSRIPLNYVLLEVLFGQLFRLPEPPVVPLFYGSLLIELCKLQPNSMPQVLAQAAELLYQRADSMQPVCIDRLVDWFSYHLSNFQYRWSWKDWEDCLDAETLSPKHVFAREVLEKCMRFSYHQRVIETVPENFTSLLPDKPQINFRLADESHALFDRASQFTQLIRSKGSPEDLLALLRSSPDDPLSPIDLTAFATFFAVLLNLASKSFSHNFAALTRYHKTLKSVVDGNEEAQTIVLRTLYELWSSHHQMMIVLVDKLLKMQIVECNIVVAWIFSDEMKPEFERIWTWEVLLGALTKLARHVERVRGDLEHIRDLATAASRQREKEGEAMEEGGDEDDLADEGKVQEKAQELRQVELFQKNLLLSVFHKFTVVLTEHLLSSETEGVDYNTNWYRWVTGRFKHVFLSQSDQLWKLCSELESTLFTADIDPHILENFHQFRALRR